MGFSNEGRYRLIQAVIPGFSWKRCPNVPTRVVFERYPTVNGRAVSLVVAAEHCRRVLAGEPSTLQLDTPEEQDLRAAQEKLRKEARRAEVLARLSALRGRRAWGHSEVYFASGVACGRRS